MDGMSLLAWIVVGGVAGWLASVAMGTQLGLVVDIIVGVVGAFIGGFLLNAVGTAGVTGFNLWSVLVAFIGAVVLLGLLRLFDGRRAINA